MVARPRTHPTPTVDLPAATAAAHTIRRHRLRLGDPHVDTLPTDTYLDDDDLTAVLAHCDTHPTVHGHIPPGEVTARATLWAYLDQQATRAAERRQRVLLGILQTGHTSTEPAGRYGRPLGLSPQNAYNTRIVLERRYPARPPAETAGSGWLAAHRDEVAELGETLVDQRPDVLATIPDSTARRHLAGLVDAVGTALGPLPTDRFATAVLAALDAWITTGPAVSADPVLRDLAARGRHLLATTGTPPG